MKKTLAFITLTLVIGCFSLNTFAFDANNPVGKWKFNAPTAPYGYEQGTIEVSKDGDAFKATMSFTGMEYKFDLEKVKFADDVLTFGLYLDGEDIFVKMTMKSKDEMSGKAIYSEGEIPLTAKRDKE
jgi:hypothetical protein